MSKKVILGVTGSIAAYKSAELTRLLVEAGFEVYVVMTAAAQELIGPATFQALSGRQVWTELWQDVHTDDAMPHISLTRDAALILVAPASADFLAKLAHGIADDLLSTLVLARECPLLVAPAMNKQMWTNPAGQRNISQLRADGIRVLGPASGFQACGEIGEGRMLEPQDILEEVEAYLQPKRLLGQSVLITAGPTFERIDAVRGITNLSSGKMGYALARAASESGARVVLISGPTALKVPCHVQRIDVISAQEMQAAVEAVISEVDIFISVAAVADYAVLYPSPHKIKKESGPITLEMVPNPDILAHIAARPDPPFCVGFAAESENLLEYARIKREQKKIPLLAANWVQHTIGQDEVELILLDDEGEHRLPRTNKLDAARQLLRHIATLRTLQASELAASLKTE